MLDNILKVGSSFDWITPLWAFIRDAHSGEPLQVNVPNDFGFGASQIASLLKENGIKVWGLMVVGDTITFTINESQASFAKYLLDRCDIPYDGRLHQIEREYAANRIRVPVRPARTVRNQSLLNRSLGEIHKLVDRLP